jgi:hypothetical protein
MFIEKIDLAAATPLKRRSKPKPLGLKLAVGVAVTLACALAIVPWTLFVAAWAVLAVIATGVRRTGATFRDALLYAGEAVIGR